MLLIFLSTDPQMLPSIFLIVPFVLIFLALFACTVSLLGLYGDISKPKRIRVGLVGASVPAILLILQSLGQLTIRDVLAVFVLFGVVYFYLSRLSVRAAN